MSGKIKRKRLTFKEKYEIIEDVKAGACKESTLSKYCISRRMYTKVINSERELLEKMKKYEYDEKKSSKTSTNIRLEAALITWFKQARERGDSISGPIIQEKARILNKKLGGPPTFKVCKLTKEDCSMYQQNCYLISDKYLVYSYFRKIKRILFINSCV